MRTLTSTSTLPPLLPPAPILLAPLLLALAGCGTADIQSNSDAISDLDGRLAELESGTVSQAELGDLGTRLGGVEDNVAANADEITANGDAIDANGDAIETNATGLAALKGRVDGLESDLTDVLSRLESLEVTTRLHVSTFSGRDGTDSGVLAGRSLRFEKARDDTRILLTYSDNLQVHRKAVGCRWELRINGERCVDPGPVVADKYTDSQYGGDSIDYDPTTVKGACVETDSGPLGAGSHTVTVAVGSVPGNNLGNCMTGWQNTTGVLIAQEVLPDGS